MIYFSRILNTFNYLFFKPLKIHYTVFLHSFLLNGGNMTLAIMYLIQFSDHKQFYKNSIFCRLLLVKLMLKDILL